MVVTQYGPIYSFLLIGCKKYGDQMSLKMDERWSDLKPELTEFNNLSDSLEPTGIGDNELSGLDGK